MKIGDIDFSVRLSGAREGESRTAFFESPALATKLITAHAISYILKKKKKKSRETTSIEKTFSDELLFLFFVFSLKARQVDVHSRLGDLISNENGALGDPRRRRRYGIGSAHRRHYSRLSLLLFGEEPRKTLEQPRALAGPAGFDGLVERPSRRASSQSPAAPRRDARRVSCFIEHQ